MQKHYQVKEKHAERLKVMQQRGGQSGSLMLLRLKMNATKKITIQYPIFLSSVFILSKSSSPFTPH